MRLLASCGVAPCGICTMTPLSFRIHCKTNMDMAELVTIFLVSRKDVDAI